MINEVAVIFRRKLRPNCVFNCESVFLHFVECSLWQPIRSIYLERVRVLPWLQVLSIGELHDHLLDGKYLFDFLVLILQRNAVIRSQVTSLDALKFEDKISGLEDFANFNVECA